MAEIPNYSNLANSGPVISPQFCASHPVNLLIDKKIFSLKTRSRYIVTSTDGNPVFKVEIFPLSFHGTLVVLDAAGTPVITLRPKKLSYHSRWEVFSGDSTDKKDLIFSVKRSSMFQIHTKLDVFLANNTAGEYCDFNLKRSSHESCDIYAGNSSTPIAQVDKKLTAGSIFRGKESKDKFMVSVSPNVDYAMVVSLIIILEEIVTRSNQNSSSHTIAGMEAGAGAGAGASAVAE